MNEMTAIEGCVYNNFPIALGESFFQACSMRCKCIRPRLIRCMERCRPIDIELEGKEGCVVVQDPEDECCHTVECLEDFTVIEEVILTNELEPRARSEDVDEISPIEGSLSIEDNN